MPVRKNVPERAENRRAREGNAPLQRQFASPIIRVEVATGRVLVDAVKDFWEREVVQSSTRTAGKF